MKILIKEIKLMGLTHEEAAKAAGVSRRALAKWVSGECNPNHRAAKLMKDAGFSDTAILNPTKDVEV